MSIRIFAGPGTVFSRCHSKAKHSLTTKPSIHLTFLECPVCFISKSSSGFIRRLSLSELSSSPLLDPNLAHNSSSEICELSRFIKLFFDTAQYPTATFKSNKVEVTGKTTAKVSGLLTLHGISKPVNLVVSLNQSGINPITDNLTAGFAAVTTIKRSDFNMTTLLPGLGDDVLLDIQAEAYQAKNK